MELGSSVACKLKAKNISRSDDPSTRIIFADVKGTLDLLNDFAVY